MQVPKIKGKEAMSIIKGLAGQKMTKDVNFMNAKVKISKLSVAEVIAIQEASAAAQTSADDGFDVLKMVIRSGVEGGSDLDDADFKAFPLDELSKLSAEIMKFSGLGAEAGK